jgi:N utilization substance protein B
MGRRRRGREFALQILFQIDLTGGAPEEVFDDFWEGQEVREDVREFAEALVQGTHRERPTLDDVISSSAEHWRVERMSVVDRNVLRLAAYEMLFEPDTPPVVVIDEAIEIAKRFGTEDSGGFINGILDDVRRRIDRGEVTRG